MFTYLLYLLILQLEFFHWKQISVDFKSQHLHDNPLFMLRGGIENLTNVPLTDDNKICLTSILTSLPIPKPQTFIETDGHRLINNTIKITDGYPTVSPSTKAVNWFLYPVSRFRTIASIESHLSLSLSLSHVQRIYSPFAGMSLLRRCTHSVTRFYSNWSISNARTRKRPDFEIRGRII